MAVCSMCGGREPGDSWSASETTCVCPRASTAATAAPAEPTINRPLTCGWCHEQFTGLAEFDGEAPVCPECLKAADNAGGPEPRPGDIYRQLAAFIDANPELRDRGSSPCINLFPASLAEFAMLCARYRVTEIQASEGYVFARARYPWGQLDINIARGDITSMYGGQAAERIISAMTTPH